LEIAVSSPWLCFSELKSESGRLVNGTNPGVDVLLDQKRKVEVTQPRADFSKNFFYAGKMYEKSTTGANPTIANYNASDVNFYNAMGSLVRFEN
jgi:hypothetical protein